MNDKYLFRGKSEYGWSFGSLHICPLTNHHHIIGGELADEQVEINLIYNNVVEIDPTTAGQCTNLKDKNSKLIFDGDILEWQRADIKNPETLRGIVTWRSDQYHVIYDFECDRYWILSAVVDRGCEIVGNIHDNPELLSNN